MFKKTTLVGVAVILNLICSVVIFSLIYSAISESSYSNTYYYSLGVISFVGLTIGMPLQNIIPTKLTYLNKITKNSEYYRANFVIAIASGVLAFIILICSNILINELKFSAGSLYIYLILSCSLVGQQFYNYKIYEGIAQNKLVEIEYMTIISNLVTLAFIYLAKNLDIIYYEVAICAVAIKSGILSAIAFDRKNTRISSRSIKLTKIILKRQKKSILMSGFSRLDILFDRLIMAYFGLNLSIYVLAQQIISPYTLLVSRVIVQTRAREIYLVKEKSNFKKIIVKSILRVLIFFIITLFLLRQSELQNFLMKFFNVSNQKIDVVINLANLLLIASSFELVLQLYLYRLHATGIFEFQYYAGFSLILLVLPLKIYLTNSNQYNGIGITLVISSVIAILVIRWKQCSKDKNFLL